MTRAEGRAFVAQARLELMGGEEADAIADAVKKLTPEAVVEVLPGQLNISAPGRLEFECADVSDALGRAWDTRELQVILANYAGYIVRMDESGVTLSWVDGASAHDQDSEVTTS
jgi:MmoB/DmpM family protein